MSTTRLQELLVGFGFGKQTDIATANTAPTIWRLRKLNASMANPKLATENDAQEYGKGHEFATQTFKTSWDVAGSLEKYLGAEIGAWAMCFGLGHSMQVKPCLDLMQTAFQPFCSGTIDPSKAVERC